MTFHSEHIVKKTRSIHACDWCGEKIESGNRAVKATGYFEDFYSGYLHLECAAARDNADWVPEDGFAIGDQARGRTDDDRSCPPQFTEEDYLKKLLK